MSTEGTLVAAVVGIDGCGKSTTYRGALSTLAPSVTVRGVGETVLSGGPGQPIRKRTDVPLTRTASLVGRAAKGRKRPRLYKQLKFIELAGRARIRDYIVAHDRADVLLTDGDPLVNIAAWAAARFYREELAGADVDLVQVLHYMAGNRRIPFVEVPRYTRRAWQLVLLNRLHVARFRFPDLVFLLQIDPAMAMERVLARGRPLQAHENESFLAELASAYERVCSILEEQCDVAVKRIDVGRIGHHEAVETVAATVGEAITRRRNAATVPRVVAPDSVEIIATTMSGSIQDQRKVSSIAHEFHSRTTLPATVHLAECHAEAAAIAHEIVERGGRTLVSAGGAGTFNAVLEGSHLNGDVPADLRLAFLRKGSADLIGKTLHIPDDLGAGVEAIASGIQADRCVEADILTVETTEPDVGQQRRHMVGFGGLGAFGEVPRFTETRFVKFYKGVLGSLFGDLGPFYVGLVLAVVWWWMRNLLGLVPSLGLTLDDRDLGPDRWGAVMILNGDLGKDFPLGRGVPLSGGSFRVVALRYQGLRKVARQIAACRTAAVLDNPDAYSAVVADVHTFIAHPIAVRAPFMVNVDGLRMTTSGTVRVSATGRVRLVDGGGQPRGGG